MLQTGKSKKLTKLNPQFEMQKAKLLVSKALDSNNQFIGLERESQLQVFRINPYIGLEQTPVWTEKPNTQINNFRLSKISPKLAYSDSQDLLVVDLLAQSTISQIKAAAEQVYWDNSDPNTLYVVENLTLKVLDTVTNSFSILKSFEAPLKYLSQSLYSPEVFCFTFEDSVEIYYSDRNSATTFRVSCQKAFFVNHNTLVTYSQNCLQLWRDFELLKEIRLKDSLDCSVCQVTEQIMLTFSFKVKLISCLEEPFKYFELETKQPINKVLFSHKLNSMPGKPLLKGNASVLFFVETSQGISFQKKQLEAISKHLETQVPSELVDYFNYKLEALMETINTEFSLEQLKKLVLKVLYEEDLNQKLLLEIVEPYKELHQEHIAYIESLINHLQEIHKPETQPNYEVILEKMLNDRDLDSLKLLLSKLSPKDTLGSLSYNTIYELMLQVLELIVSNAMDGLWINEICRVIPLEAEKSCDLIEKIFLEDHPFLSTAQSILAERMQED